MISAEQIQVFYDIAMSIGESSNIYEMLQKSLMTYLRKLNCSSALVYKTHKTNKGLYTNELFFSLPFTANIKSTYGLVESVLPEKMTKKEYQSFQNSLPSVVALFDSQFFHIFSLPQFGFLVLVKNIRSLKEEIFDSLQRINKKLSLSCIACLNTEALIASEKKYKDLSELLPEMICEIDKNGIITYINKFAIYKTGYTQKDISKGVHIVSLFHEDEKERASANFIEALKTDEGISNEYKIKAKDGQVLSVIVYANRIIANKKAIGLRAVIIDISERKLNEIKLRQYAERLELALVGSDAGLWDWNIETGSVFYSERWCAMLGYAIDEIEPTINTWEKLVYPQDLLNAQEMLDLHLKGKIPLYQTKQRMLAKDGTWKWILDTGKVTERDKNGKAIRAVGTHIDITEREIANEKLREQSILLEQSLIQQTLLSDIALELNYAESFSLRINSVLKKIGEHTGVSRTYIFEDSDDGLLTSNTYEWCNFGVEPQIDELQNIPYEILPSWKKIFKEKGRVYSENIKELPEDIRVILEPQNIKSIIIYPLYVRNNFFGFIGFDECMRHKKWANTELELLRTISGIIANSYERKISEKSLKESESKNRAILESIPDIIFHINKEGTILSFRSSSKKDLAVRPENFINKPIAKLFPKKFSAQVVNAVEKCLEDNYHLFEYSMVIEGKENNFEARMSKMNDDEVIAIIRNVSERKEYEQKLKEERDRANKASKAKTEFLANMSHEIRTPMNAIIGFSESLYNLLENPQHKKMVSTILDSSNLLLSLLNDILDLSKIEAGKLELNIQTINVGYIFEEIKKFFDEKAEKKGIQISIIQENVIPDNLNLDDIRIKQVLFNLVGNALKFTHGGFVNICASFDQTAQNTGKLTIKVEDSGIGIPKDQQDTIFEAFEQQSGQSTRIYGGAGLGLSIVKRLILKMGGKISLESEMHKGSTFTIVLPNVEIALNDKNIKQPNIGFSAENIVFDNALLFVVDDVLVNAEIVKTLLSATNILVNSVQNGENAFEYLMHNEPDIILLDLRMPGMDGFEFAAKIKENEQLKTIPIVAYTANATDKEMIQKNIHFDSVLLKPTNRTMLYEMLMKYIKYSVKQDSRVENKPEVIFELPEQVKKQLPQIISLLESKYLKQWDGVSKSLVLFNIEEFALQLLKEYEEVGVPILINYAKQLLEDIDMVDLESLEITLTKFPSIIEILKKEA